MSIARIDAGALLALGMDRQTVEALRHIIRQVGSEVGAVPLPTVTSRTDVLAYRSALLEDVSTSAAAGVDLVSLTVPQQLKAGAVIAGRIVGVTSNGTTPGTLNLWLSVGGVKVLTHAFTTPDVPGAGKGFAADFTVTVRSAGSVMAGGVLSLAYNAPTVLPAVSAAPVAIPAGPAVVALGMHWSAADAANIATAKVAFLSVGKL